MSATAPVDATVELTVDELARLAGVPVRTIREYQTLRLLPPPRRQGRVGLYGTPHVERMRTIARLAGRGYSLAAIRDLFEARHAGADLGSLLGDDATGAAFDETPLRLSMAELRAGLPGLTAEQLREAQVAGLFQPDGRGHALGRSPALVALTAEAIGAGVAPAAAYELIGQLRDGLAELSSRLADHLSEQVLDPLQQSIDGDEFVAFLRRARLLLLQGVASLFADRLGDALIARAAAQPDGGPVRAAVEAVRVGAIADGAGNLERWRRP